MTELMNKPRRKSELLRMALVITSTLVYVIAGYFISFWLLGFVLKDAVQYYLHGGSIQTEKLNALYNWWIMCTCAFGIVGSVFGNAFYIGWQLL